MNGRRRHELVDDPNVNEDFSDWLPWPGRRLAVQAGPEPPPTSVIRVA